MYTWVNVRASFPAGTPSKWGNGAVGMNYDDSKPKKRWEQMAVHSERSATATNGRDGGNGKTQASQASKVGARRTEELLRSSPPEVRGAYARMHAAIKRGDNKAVRRELVNADVASHEHFSDDDPLSVILHRDFVMCYMMFGEWDEALHHARVLHGHAVRAFSERSIETQRVRVLLGTALIHTGQVEEGALLLERHANAVLNSSTIGPNYHVMTLEGLAVGFLEQGNEEVAHEYLSMAQFARTML